MKKVKIKIMSNSPPTSKFILPDQPTQPFRKRFRAKSFEISKLSEYPTPSKTSSETTKFNQFHTKPKQFSINDYLNPLPLKPSKSKLMYCV